MLYYSFVLWCWKEPQRKEPFVRYYEATPSVHGLVPFVQVKYGTKKSITQQKKCQSSDSPTQNSLIFR